MPPPPLPSEAAALFAQLRTHAPPGRQVALHDIPPPLVLPLFHALQALHCTAVFLHPRWHASDAAAAARHLDLHFLVHAVDTNVADAPPLPLPHVPRLALHRDEAGRLHLTPSNLSAPHQPPPCAPTTYLADGPLPPAIFFTSGTTAAPKPVLLPYTALRLQAAAKQELLPYAPTTVLLHLAPLYHIGGFSSALAVTLANGTHVFPPPNLHPTRRTHAAQLLEHAAAHAVNTLVVVPAVLHLLLDAAADARTLPRLTAVLCGGAPLPTLLRHRARLVFSAARFVTAYGMTETASSLTFVVHDDLPRNSPLHTSAGWPPAHVQLRVEPCRDGGSSNGAAGSVVGEVMTRGPHLMHGYIGEGGCVDGVDEDGWFRTGDLGYVDASSGALHLVGRRKDMIKSAGENVFAPEVERMLLSMTEVREAAVVGIPHHVLGEAVAAAVVLFAGRKAPVDEVLRRLQAACRDALSPFKRPKWIVSQNELPRSATGKVLKDLVREQLQRHIYPVVAVAKL